MVWYSHLFQNFPQFIVIHTVKGCGIVNKAEIDVFLELSCFSNDPVDVGNLISGSSAFSKTCLGLVHWDDPEGWYGEGGGRRVQDGEHMYTHGWFMSMYGKNHYNIVISLQLK